MNNAKAAIETLFLEADEPQDTQILLRQKLVETEKILKALLAVNESREWQTLKELVLDGVVQTLEKRLRQESNKAVLDGPEIYRVQGQLAWARRYADLSKLADAYKIELNNLTRKLNENEDTEPIADN